MTYIVSMIFGEVGSLDHVGSGIQRWDPHIGIYELTLLVSYLCCLL